MSVLCTRVAPALPICWGCKPRRRKLKHIARPRCTVIIIIKVSAHRLHVHAESCDNYVVNCNIAVWPSIAQPNSLLFCCHLPPVIINNRLGFCKCMFVVNGYLS